MNKVIWKYELVLGLNEIKIPEGAEVLSVQTQHESICMWCLLNPQVDAKERWFEIYGTGHLVKYDMGVERKFLGTVQMSNADYIYHVFERIN